MNDETIRVPLSGRDAQFDPCTCGENQWQLVMDVDVVTMDTAIGARCVECDAPPS